MFGQICDSLGEAGNLEFGGSGIVFGTAVLDSHFCDAFVECCPCGCGGVCFFGFVDVSYVYDEVFGCGLVNVGDFVGCVSE